MELSDFLALPTPAIAQIVQEKGLRTCAYPVNGTRRWAALEIGDIPPAQYLTVMLQHVVDLGSLIFEHGMENLLIPLFSAPILERGQTYISQHTAPGLRLLAQHPLITNYCARAGVRVHFYGDYARYFQGTPDADLIDLFAAFMARTRTHDRHRLFFGVLGQDATDTTAELAVRYYQQHQRIPDKAALVEMYFGEPLAPVDMFVGFSKFRAFDMPLVANSRTALYFNLCPSPYLTPTQWRTILYDYLFARQEPKIEYQALTPTAKDRLRRFYQQNTGHTLGVGRYEAELGIWYPLPQVNVP